jgi:hypothetical protein
MVVCLSAAPQLITKEDMATYRGDFPYGIDVQMEFTITSRLEKTIKEGPFLLPTYIIYTYTTKEGFLVRSYDEPMDGLIGKRVRASGAIDNGLNFIVIYVDKVY